MGARFSVHTLHWKTRTDITTGALTHVNIYIKERLFIRLDRLFIIYFLYLCTRLNRGSAWGQTTGCKHGLIIGLARYWVYDRPLTPPIGLFFEGGVNNRESPCLALTWRSKFWKCCFPIAFSTKVMAKNHQIGLFLPFSSKKNIKKCHFSNFPLRKKNVPRLKYNTMCNKNYHPHGWLIDCWQLHQAHGWLLIATPHRWWLISCWPLIPGTRTAHGS